MNKRMSTRLVIILTAILLTCATAIYAQEERAKAPFKPVEPPRLYVAPTADVIPSLDFSMAASGIFGQQALSYQGTVAFGLADIAQLEASAINIGSSLKEGLGNVYTPGFKMKLLRTGKWKHSSGITSPGLAWALRSSIWGEEEAEDGTIYEQKYADLYFVATERLGPCSFHGGLDIIDARMRDEEMKKKEDYIGENYFAPFGGFDAWMTERGKVMAEFGWIPNFKYTEEKDEDKIEFVWVALLGVRFFVTRYIAADVGVRYQGNYEGVSDASIQVKIDASIPTHLLYEYARGRY